MKRVEFEALLRIQDRRLVMCDVVKGVHDKQEKSYAADVVDRRWNLVMGGSPAKTPAAAVQRSIAQYFKQNANH